MTGLTKHYDSIFCSSCSGISSRSSRFFLQVKTCTCTVTELRIIASQQQQQKLKKWSERVCWSVYVISF